MIRRGPLALIALYIGACAGKAPTLVPIPLGVSDLGACALVGADAGTCEETAVREDGTRIDRLFMQRIANRRGIPFLWDNHVRVTLDVTKTVGCVRVTERDARQLGYDDAQDWPSRHELELEPAAQRVSFVLAADPKEDSSPANALQNLVSRLDGAVEIDAYASPCAGVCPGERGVFTLRLDPNRGAVAFKNPDTTTCRFLGSRAIAAAQRPDAVAPPPPSPPPPRDAGRERYD